jgi:hypothetical protein
MSQSPEPDTSEPRSREVVEETVVLGRAALEHASDALPAERSQFSQRLASFGLGESPDPLLKPAKPQSSRKPRRT